MPFVLAVSIEHEGLTRKLVRELVDVWHSDVVSVPCLGLSIHQSWHIFSPYPDWCRMSVELALFQDKEAKRVMGNWMAVGLVEQWIELADNDRS